MKRFRKKLIPAGWATLILVAGLTASLLPMACGSSSETTTAGSGTTNSNSSSQDRAARLAAQTQLRNAQMAQEVYFVDNEKYASSTSVLKNSDANVSSKVEVTRGDRNGYEMQVRANDSAQTVFILRKNGSSIERVDENGDSW